MPNTLPEPTGNPERDRFDLELHDEVNDLLAQSRVFVYSPNGTKYEITVNNSGTLSATQVN